MPKEIPKHQPNVKPALLNETPAKKNTIPKEKKTSTQIPMTSKIKKIYKNNEKKKEINDEATMSTKLKPHNQVNMSKEEN